MGPVYKLQIVHNDGVTIATFHGRGEVERDLVASITAAVLKRGGWWLRPSKLQAAVAAAIDDVLMDAKREVTLKHLG